MAVTVFLYLPWLVGVEEEEDELDEGNSIRYSGIDLINEGLGGRGGAEVWDESRSVLDDQFLPKTISFKSVISYAVSS